MAVPILSVNLAAHTSARAADVMADLNAIVAQMNGNIDRNNLKDLEVITSKLADGGVTGPKLDPAILAAIGVNDGVSVRRGHCFVPGEEIRANAAFGLMSTADVVAGVVLPAAGLLRVAYSAAWKSSAAGAGVAVICLNNVPVKAVSGSAAPVSTGAPPLAATEGMDSYRYLTSFAGGLRTFETGNVYTGDVATGQVLGGSDGAGSPSGDEESQGGFATIFAAAGVYNVSVQFKSAAGSVSAKNRQLWVEAVGF